jgi:membrane associated rhomboid family serine protease
MFIPLRHENMAGRRWPVISIALIVINFAVFFGTHWTMEGETPERKEVRAHVLLLAAMHPELKIPADVQDFVTAFQQNDPATWKRAQSQTRDLADAWDAKIRLIEEPTALQREMDSLSGRFAEMEKNSLVEQYAFTPAHPRAISYLTANFLHGGWLHIIGNMWFLWLAGAILEDTWGRIIYPIFYFLAGAAALQFHAWSNPGSLVPTLGASGAVAALMGAFLVRYPTTKIEVALVLGLRSLSNLAMGRGIRFKAAAYWLLPLWLLMEVFSGAISGQTSGVAHWAHVGGFVFGGLAALAMRYSGLENKANEAIEAKVSWTGDPGIVRATEQMEHGKLDEAIASLQAHIASKPDSIDACTLLQQIYWRKNDIPSYHAAILKLCQLHLKAQEGQAALQDYDEYLNSGGSPVPASTWLDLCRAMETRQDFDRAAAEYQKLAEAYPKDRSSLLALIAAGRLSLKQLNRPSEALRLYEEASASSVPHLDWQTNIESGIQNAQKALSGSQVPMSKV